MKTIKLTVLCLLLSISSLGNAWADHRHSHGHGHINFGLSIAPYWGPSYYPAYRHWQPYYPTHYPTYSPYYYPPVVVERPAPQVYVEQQPAPAAPPAPTAAAPSNYWYYCSAPSGYYPYVRECRSGWQRVLPQPPGQP